MTESKPSFTVATFKTANKNLNSMCHVGIAQFNNGVLSDTFDSYLNILNSEKITNKNYTQELLKGNPYFRDFNHEIEKALINNGPVVTFENNIKILKETLGTLKPYDFFFFDAADLFKNVLKGKVKKINLPNLADFFGLAFEEENPVSESKLLGEIICKLYDEERTFDRDIRNKTKLHRFVEFAK